MNSCVVDLVLLENGEDVSVGVAAGALESGVGINGDPEYDVLIEDVLAVFIGGREAHRQRRRNANTTLLVLEQLDDLGSDCSLPEGVGEDLVDDSMSSFLRDDGVPVLRNDEGTLPDIGTVEEEGRIVGKAGVEMDPFEGRDEVCLDGCGLGVGEVGETCSLAGRRRGRGGRSNWMVFQVGAQALGLEDR